MVDYYSWELSGQLDVTVQSYEKDRKRYWENLGGWSDILYEQAERFAQAVLKNTEQLILAEEIDGDLSKLQYEMNRVNKISELIKRINDIANMDIPSDERYKLIRDLAKECPPDPQDDESPLKLVWEKFIIDISYDAIGKIEEGAARIFQLYKLVLRSIPSPSTQQFLGRLSRCYIWGFDPECVILCRCVIDTAFKDRVTYEICEKHFEKRRKRKYDFSLSDRIRAAQKEKIIDKEIAKKARRVKTRGDKAVHNQPGMTKDVWGTICDTVEVLEKIKRQN